MTKYVIFITENYNPVPKMQNPGETTGKRYLQKDKKKKEEREREREKNTQIRKINQRFRKTYSPVMAITDIPPTSVVAEPIGRVFPVSSFGSQYQRRVVPAPFCKRPPCLPWNQPTIFPPSKHLYTTQKNPQKSPKK